MRPHDHLRRAANAALGLVATAGLGLAAMAALALAAIALLGLASGHALAQQPAAQQPAMQQLATQPPTTTDDGHTITLDVLVNNKDRQHVSGLSAADFTLLDNKQAAKILSVREVDTHRPATDPVRVVIVVDMINTAFDVVARERQRLDEYLKQDGGHLAHPTSMAVMTEKGISLEKASVTDGNALATGLDSANSVLRMVGRSAGFWGATDRLQWSLQQLQELVAYESTQPGRKLILFLSPGWPMLSYQGIDETDKQRKWVFDHIVTLTNTMRQNHIALYSLTPYTLGVTDPFYYRTYLKPVTKPSQAEFSELSLQVLATHSGGVAETTGMDTVGELTDAMRDGHAYYQITFEAAPGDHPDEYHAVEIKTDKPDTTTRTASGYYAHTAH